MSYSVKSIDVFERQAKRLIKKYASLKAELLNLINDLKIHPQQGKLLGITAIKYGSVYLPKERENPVVQEL